MHKIIWNHTLWIECTVGYHWSFSLAVALHLLNSFTNKCHVLLVCRYRIHVYRMWDVPIQLSFAVIVRNRNTWASGCKCDALSLSSNMNNIIIIVIINSNSSNLLLPQRFDRSLLLLFTLLYKNWLWCRLFVRCVEWFSDVATMTSNRKWDQWNKRTHTHERSDTYACPCMSLYLSVFCFFLLLMLSYDIC